MTLLKKINNKIFFAFIFSLVSISAHAGSIDNKYPWDDFLSKMAEELQSNFALFIAIACIAICAGAVMFGDLQGGARKAFNAGLGISIVFGIPVILSSLFGQGALLH